jgi:hypothetical protein
MACAVIFNRAVRKIQPNHIQSGTDHIPQNLWLL